MEEKSRKEEIRLKDESRKEDISWKERVEIKRSFSKRKITERKIFVGGRVQKGRG